MNKIRATIAALAVAVPLGVVAAPANAVGELTARCWVDPGGYARLSVTRYPKGSGVEYHMDLNSYTPLVGYKYYQSEITISGAALPGTNDQYRDFTGTQSRTVRGYWQTSSGAVASCAVTI